METGQILGEEFLLQKQLQNEPTGEIWRALDVNVGRLVRLHILPKIFSCDPSAMDRFCERFELMQAAMDIPSIVRPERIVRLPDNNIFLVSRYVDGVTLDQYASLWVDTEGEFPFHLVFTALCPVALALDAVHALGLSHRCLVPERIIVSQIEGVCLFDLELVALIREYLGTSDPLAYRTHGNATRYLAPEQLPQASMYRMSVESPEFAPERFFSDQYALAAIATELILAPRIWRTDFQGDRNEFWKGIMSQLSSNSFSSGAAPPHHVIEAIRRALDANSAIRFPSCNVLMDVLTGQTHADPVPSKESENDAAASVSPQNDIFLSFKQIRQLAANADAGPVVSLMRKERKIHRIFVFWNIFMVLAGLTALCVWLSRLRP